MKMRMEVGARQQQSATSGTARQLINGRHVLSDRVISRAIGEELRRSREALGWSRLLLLAEMPSGIGDRTLLSYEHGTRHLTVLRFIEISRALRVPAATLLSRALQRARIYVENLNLRVDLRALVVDKSATYRPMVQWARNALNEHPDGIAELEPAVVRNLALFVGCRSYDLAHYLARFIPDEPEPDSNPADDGQESEPSSEVDKPL